MYSWSKRFSFSSLSWSWRTSSIRFASACNEDCRVCAWLERVSKNTPAITRKQSYSCRLFLTPSSSLSRSSLVLRGLIARASSGGYSGFSRWYMSLPLGIMIELDLCLSPNLGRSMRVFLGTDWTVERMLLSQSGIDEEADDTLDKGGESWGLYGWGMCESNWDGSGCAVMAVGDAGADIVLNMHNTEKCGWWTQLRNVA